MIIGKRVLLIGLAAMWIFTVSISASGVSEKESNRIVTREIKIALDGPADLESSGTYVWAAAFIDYLKQNALPLSVYPQDALGGEDERLDQIIQGLLEVSMSDVAMVGGIDKTIYGFQQPYMFTSLEHLDRTLANSNLLKIVNEKVTPKGVRVLALVCSGTPGGIANTKKPIKVPADMKGLRIRAKDGVQAEFISAWGASAVVVPWAEIYNALQTGIANGYVNSAVVPLMFTHQEVLNYFSEIKFNIPLRVAICSEDWYRSLSDKDRDAVDKAVIAATKANREWTSRISNVALDNLRKAGIEVYVNTQNEINQFADLVKPVLQKVLGKENAELFINASNANR